ncbi:MAG: hypothetical protein PHW01_01695 [Patescibacteria group bacterium]|nr:hypothetical protein [Patescibacteria group bacterium]
MSKNYDQRIDECTGSAFTAEILHLGNGVHVTAHQKAEEDRNHRMRLRELETYTVDLELPEAVKNRGWFPVVQSGSFKIVKDPRGIIPLNGEIPQITSEQAQNVLFLSRNTIVQSGIDKYGGMMLTKTEVPYSEIIDYMNKARVFNICHEANKLGL